MRIVQWLRIISISRLKTVNSPYQLSHISLNACHENLVAHQNHNLSALCTCSWGFHYFCVLDNDHDDNSND